jgi:hypothetical protein
VPTGDSLALLAATYHIHCRHGDGPFSKNEFLTHHYDHVRKDARGNIRAHT